MSDNTEIEEMPVEDINYLMSDVHSSIYYVARGARKVALEGIISNDPVLSDDILESIQECVDIQFNFGEYVHLDIIAYPFTTDGQTRYNHQLVIYTEAHKVRASRLSRLMSTVGELSTRQKGAIGLLLGYSRLSVEKFMARQYAMYGET